MWQIPAFFQIKCDILRAAHCLGGALLPQPFHGPWARQPPGVPVVLAGRTLGCPSLAAAMLPSGVAQARVVGLAPPGGLRLHPPKLIMMPGLLLWPLHAPVPTAVPGTEAAGEG